MTRKLFAVLGVVAVAACGGGRDARETAAADSLSRDLQLAPVDSTAELNDRPTDTVPAAEPTPPPAAKPAAAKPKPAPAKPRPKPTQPAPEPSAPAERALAAGTTINTTATNEIRSHKTKVGETLTTQVAADIKDTHGRVVIPAGSTVTLTVTAIKESENKSDTTGTLTLMPKDITVDGRTYTLNASIDQVETKLVDRGTNAGDIAKVGGGAAAGAIVGRVLGGSKKGAVIGGVIGGAVGAQRAVETQDRDIVVPVGARVRLSLTERFVAQGS